MVQIAFSVYENQGVFALLLGSGLSRAAGIPTGWEITVDLIRRIGHLQGVEDPEDWATWYQETTGKKPDYSELLEEVTSTQAERRTILNRYIEPSDEEHEEGKKLPTKAHHAIARLVQGGYIKVIVTTNFDRLMENALHDLGIEPTIVSSVDALVGAEPIAHCHCFILKLHGDYKDSRILNTELELSRYEKQYDELLDQIFDEYGLILCGWSGEWDDALRQALFRASSRRYPTYWTARGDLGEGAQGLVAHRRATVIQIADADGFFSALREHVETLEQTQLQHPRTIELLANSTKRFLAKPEYRIQLNDLLTQEATRLIAFLDTGDIAKAGRWNEAIFRTFVKQYESGSQALTIMCGVLGRWGDDSEHSFVVHVIQKLCVYEAFVEGGATYNIPFRLYPAVLIFTAYGLGLVRAGRYRTLHCLFDSPIHRKYKKQDRIVEILFLGSWQGSENQLWQQIDGLERRKTALSDHLFMLFSEWGKFFTEFTSDFELIFEHFEILGSLAYLEKYIGLKQEISSGWMPIGRSGWNESYANRLLDELQEETLKKTLVEAGFTRGDIGFIDSFIYNFQERARRMRW